MEKKIFELPNMEIDTCMREGLSFEDGKYHPLHMVIEVSEDGDVRISELSSDGLTGQLIDGVDKSMVDRLERARQLMNYLLEEYLFFEVGENLGFTCSDSELKERMQLP